MSEHFIDSFGFGDNEFDDNEDGRLVTHLI